MPDARRLQPGRRPIPAKDRSVNLHQFRFVREAVRQNLSLTAAAKALHTSQPGISKSIIELEDELGIEIFTRHGKRLSAVTEQGKLVVAAAERILREVESLKRVGADYATQDQGELIIAATYTYARYLLPKAIARLKARFPQIAVTIRQGSAAQVADMVRNGTADLVLTAADLSGDARLLTLPCVALRPIAVVPADHPFVGKAQLELGDLAGFALVVDDETFGHEEIFGPGKATPDVALRAADAAMVKTYVELGLGVGIVADMAFDAQRDCGLRALPIALAADPQMACAAFRRNAFTRNCLHALVELLSPAFAQEAATQAILHTTTRRFRKIRTITWSPATTQLLRHKRRKTTLEVPT